VTEVILRRRAAAYVGEVGFFAVDDDGANLMGKISLGRDVGCDVIQRRNPRHHRLFFGIVKFVREHCPMWEGAPTDQVVVALKLATGLVTTFVDSETGKAIWVPKSISWAAMDQTEFNPWFDLACKEIARRWMPAGTTPESIRDELFLLMDGPGAIGSKYR
jgi:hypothetical protein